MTAAKIRPGLRTCRVGGFVLVNLYIDELVLILHSHIAREQTADWRHTIIDLGRYVEGD